MTAFTDLDRAVQQALASGRLGPAVFVRCLVQSPDAPGSALPTLVRAATTIRGWLGQPVVRVYALGSPDGSQVSLTLEFRDGGTALVSWSHGPPRGDGVDLTVLGSRGALYHDAGAAEAWDAVAGSTPGTDPGLRSAIEQSLRSGKPEPVEGASP
jgi:predicted dehydrogenase